MESRDLVSYDDFLSLDVINAWRYHGVVILSFACAETERIFRAELSLRLPQDIQRGARRKLLALHAATELRHLMVPPGNRLEALKGGRKGQHSIRINDQWRICFRWGDGNAQEVEIVDYH
jgi:proteic killer suppression protein